MTSITFNRFTVLRLALRLVKVIPWLIGGVIVATVGYCFVSSQYKLHLNVSDSLPAYVFMEAKRPPAIGDVVMFCPSLKNRAVQELFYRGLMYRDVNTKCEARLVPLAKVLVALEGSTVQVTVQGLVIDNRLLPNTKPLTFDRQGRPLTSMALGAYQVQPGQAWVASTYNERSFDSRYYGPVEAKGLVTLETLF